MLAIFDLDDTLIDTSDLFWRVREEYLQLLNVPNMLLEDVRADFEKEDTRSIQDYGFQPDRYGKTMIRLYDTLINSGQLSNSEKIRNQIKLIGNKISTEIPSLIDGAFDVLNFCKKNKYKMALLTRGSEEVQQRKIQSYRLENYFGKNTFIVERKTQQIFLGVLSKMHDKACNTWSIGDSIKSDINPALSIGINCIHFQYKHSHYNWIQEHGDKPLSTKYFTVNKLDLVPDILLKKSTNKKDLALSLHKTTLNSPFLFNPDSLKPI